MDGVSVRALAEPVILEGFWLIEPGRPPVSAQREAESFTPLGGQGELDLTIYGSAEPYPSERAELVSIQQWGGFAIALIKVFPVQYLPAEGRLIYATQLSLEVTLAAGSLRVHTAAPRPSLSRARSQVANFVDNPETLSTYPQAGLHGQVGAAPEVDYLLLTRSNLVEAFLPLVDRKEQAGLVVRVETVESITNRYAGRDVPEKLRNCIRDAYTQRGIRYVLLGGDTQAVPCRNAYARMGSLVPPNTTIPCDLYYACLDGSWNGNGNTLWGEATDGEDGGEVDLLAEVSVGRAPVDTLEEVTTFVEKSLRYETQGHPQATNALFMAEFLDTFPTGPAQGADMFEPLQPFFREYQIRWLDDRPFTTPQWTTTDAIEALNTSPHLALFNGHGDIDLIMRMYTEDLDRLSNPFPFLAYSVGCNAGEFDNDKFSPDCIGEELIKRHNAGAFAAILNSREGWYDPEYEWKYSGEFQTRFFDHLLARHQTNLGVAHQMGKHDLAGLVETTGSLMTYRWCYYEINLFGDPHLPWHLPAQPPDLTDADGDGMSGWEEAIAGTNPGDASSVLRLAVKPSTAGAARLDWPSVAGRAYSVLRAYDPSGGFVVVADNLAATPPLNSFDDTEAGTDRRFYRIQVRRL